MHLYERVQLGYDHAVLAAHVMHEWLFPDALCQAVAWHHQPGRAFDAGGEMAKMVALMRVADQVVHAMEDGVTEADALEFSEHVLASSAGGLLPFSPQVFEAMWPRMREARDEMIALLG